MTQQDKFDKIAETLIVISENMQDWTDLDKLTAVIDFASKIFDKKIIVFTSAELDFFESTSAYHYRGIKIRFSNEK